MYQKRRALFYSCVLALSQKPRHLWVSLSLLHVIVKTCHNAVFLRPVKASVPWRIVERYNRLGIQDSFSDTTFSAKVRMETLLGPREAIAGLRLNDPTLRHLRVYKLESENVHDFSEALKYNTSVKELSLAYNSLGNEGVKAIAEAVTYNRSLTKLDLHTNSIGDGGAVYLAEALKQNPILLILDLRNNSIGDKGASALAGGLAHNGALMQLDLLTNSIGDEGATVLADALKYNHVLQKLVLRANSIGNAGAIAFASSFSFNEALGTLDLGSNSIGDEGAKAIAGKLKQSSTLNQLLLDSNLILAQGVAMLVGDRYANTIFDGQDQSETLSVLRHNTLLTVSLPRSTKKIKSRPTNSSFVSSLSTMAGRVYQVNENDVLFGKSPRISSHRGNIGFRLIVDSVKSRSESTMGRKANIAKRIVEQIRGLNPPGRFLKEDVFGGYWYDVGDDWAVEFVCQELRPYKRSDTLDEQIGTDNRFSPKSSPARPSLPPGKIMMRKERTCVSSITTDISEITKTTYDDLLTVFQASPLAYFNGSNNDEALGIDGESLDFSLERQMLTRTLKDGRINVGLAFEPATPTALGSFLSRGEGRVMHISCHGHPQALALDNGIGALHYVHVNELKNWIQAGGSKLHFVFISACSSQLAGEAFVQAGVEHVVCCLDNLLLNDVAAIEFTRSFYHALVSGRYLDEAFDFAQQQVSVSTDIPPEQFRFVLLPEGRNHHVAVFRKCRRTRMSSPKPVAYQRRIPRQPEVFKGRRVDVYKVLEALRTSRLVNLVGPAGIGKVSLAKAVCQNLHKREPQEEIVWVPGIHVAPSDTLSMQLIQMYDLLKDVHTPPSELRVQGSYKRCLKGILNALPNEKALIVINAKLLSSAVPKKKLRYFLEDLLEDSAKVRVLVVNKAGHECLVDKFPGRQPIITLSPLSLEHTIVVFGSLCRHVWERRSSLVGNATQLCDLILPQEDGAPFDNTAGAKRLYEMLGKGNPEQIHRVAKAMSASEYDKLIQIASSPTTVPKMRLIRNAFHRASAATRLQSKRKNAQS